VNREETGKTFLKSGSGSGKEEKKKKGARTLKVQNALLRMLDPLLYWRRERKDYEVFFQL